MKRFKKEISLMILEVFVIERDSSKEIKMIKQRTFKKVNLWKPLGETGETSVGVDGGRIPSLSELAEPEIELLLSGAEEVLIGDKKFIKTSEVAGRYDNGIPYKHLQYKVR